MLILYKFEGYVLDYPCVHANEYVRFFDMLYLLICYWSKNGIFSSTWIEIHIIYLLRVVVDSLPLQTDVRQTNNNAELIKWIVLMMA